MDEEEFLTICKLRPAGEHNGLFQSILDSSKLIPLKLIKKEMVLELLRRGKTQIALMGDNGEEFDAGATFCSAMGIYERMQKRLENENE